MDRSETAGDRPDGPAAGPARTAAARAALLLGWGGRAEGRVALQVLALGSGLRGDLVGLLAGHAEPRRRGGRALTGIGRGDLLVIVGMGQERFHRRHGGRVPHEVDVR